MLTKKIIIPMALVAFVGAGIYGVSSASATGSAQTSLVQKIADKFGLDKAKVQAVFDQNRDEHQADRETKYEARLSQAVTDKKLTSAQKDSILTEHKKLETELVAAKDKTGADRRTVMQTVRTEGQKWAKDNNIDAKWLIGPGHLRGGHGGRGMDANQTSASPAPAAQPDDTTAPNDI